MDNSKADKLRATVRKDYAAVANCGDVLPGCVPQGSCCGGTSVQDLLSGKLGYSESDLTSIPEGANLGLGCGNPQLIAQLKPGEVMVDLGSGAGFDCFLASPKVGTTGKVIGVDMTPDMLSKARSNAEKGNYNNVDFRLGEIEHLPIADSTADIIMSNCVVNLSPDKQQVYKDAFRVLKPGGRLAMSDVVALKELPDNIRQDLHMYSSCIGGASLVDNIEQMLKNAGFTNIKIAIKPGSRELIKSWSPDTDMENYVASANITASKPL